MTTINVKSIYKVDTISKTNSEAWKILRKAAEEQEGDVLFDFRGIELAEPWANEEFKKFLAIDRVHMKLYSSEKTAKTIEIACLMGNMKTGRVTNEEIVSEKKVSKEEIAIQREAEELQKYIAVVNGKHVLEIYKKYQQIGSVSTVAYIRAAIKKYCAEKEIREIEIDTASLFIQKNVMGLLADMQRELLAAGITVTVESKDEETRKKLNIHTSLNLNVKLSPMEKYTLFKQEFPPLSVGLLTKYKKSRAVDEFGRYGKGEPSSCRVAIFKGFKKGSKGILCLFKTYNGNTLYTKEHWALQHDGEELRQMITEDIAIPIDMIGISNKFIGSTYHLNEPIQYDKEDSDIILRVDEEGKLTRDNVTIPERIKTVFDSWDIKYNVEMLERAIKQTDIELGISK